MPLETTPDRSDPRSTSPRFPDNPVGDAHEKMQHEDGPFFLCHHNVGELKPNDVVSAKELGPGAQIERLLKLGAMSVASREYEEAYKAHLAGLPPKPKAVDVKVEKAAEVPNSTQKVEPGKMAGPGQGPGQSTTVVNAPGGGLSGPPKGN